MKKIGMLLLIHKDLWTENIVKKYSVKRNMQNNITPHKNYQVLKKMIIYALMK